MKCPVCEGVRMREVEKDGVLIDICPDCKGVWLERGELEKLMKGVRELQEIYGRLEQQNASHNGGYAGQAQVPPPTNSSQPSYGNQPNYGHQQQTQHGYGSQKPPYGNGYDKHGYPYKKKKTVLDVFGDLFD